MYFQVANEITYAIHVKCKQPEGKITPQTIENTWNILTHMRMKNMKLNYKSKETKEATHHWKISSE